MKAIKYISISIFLIFAFSMVKSQSGQCLTGGCASGGDQFPSTTQTTTSSTFVTVSTSIYAGEWQRYEVTEGATYEWSLCPDDGGSSSYDSQLTLYNDSNTALCYSDDVCGTDAKIQWTATYTGYVRTKVNEYNCNTNLTSTTLVWRMSDPGTPSYAVEFVSMDFGSSDWCTGTSREVAVTLKNVGTETWDINFNVGVKWNGWSDYHLRTSVSGLAPDATETYYLTIEAKEATAGPSYGVNLSSGVNNLTFDVVKEGDCWFGTNTGSCGPGNSVYTSSNIDILPIPVNDLFADAILLECDDTQIENTDCATADDAPTGCTGGGTPAEGVWYYFVGTGLPVAITTDFAETTMDTQINIYEGESCAALSCIGGDDNSGTGNTSEYSFFSQSGTTYYLYVDGNGGDFKVGYTCEECQANTGTKR
jgi:hypothetical protein